VQHNDLPVRYCDDFDVAMRLELLIPELVMFADSTLELACTTYDAAMSAAD
jgi:hypothetical protein